MYKKDIIINALFLLALFFILGCNKGTLDRICKASVGLQDVESCKKVAQKVLEKSSLSKNDLEQVAKNVSNVSEYEKNKITDQLNAAVILVTDSFLALNDSAKVICERMKDNKNLKPQLSVDDCAKSLRSTCENEEEFAIAICVKTAALCDEYFLGSMSKKCSDETNRLFISLIMTNEKKTCELADGEKKLLPSFDTARCEDEIAAGRCDTDDLFAINNCIKDSSFCGGLFMDNVRKKCMHSVQQAIALPVKAEELKTCLRAEDKKKLTKGIDTTQCQRLLSDGKCGKNDLFSMTNCLDNEIFCRNFFFASTNEHCMGAIKKTMAIAIGP